MSKAIVLLSGGIDSAVVLGLAMREQGSVTALHLSHGQPQQTQEHTAARAIAKHYGVPLKVLHLGWQLFYLEGGPDPVVLPLRNGVFLMCGAAFGLTTDHDSIYAGMYCFPASSWQFPDETPEFQGAMKAAIWIGSDHKMRLHLPLEGMTKAEVVSLGKAIGVPLDLTWTCYFPTDSSHPCGVCPACIKREGALRLAGGQVAERGNCACGARTAIPHNPWCREADDE